MSMIITVAAVIWGVPLAVTVLGGSAAILSPRARDFLGRQLIAE